MMSQRRFPYRLDQNLKKRDGRFELMKKTALLKPSPILAYFAPIKVRGNEWGIKLRVSTKPKNCNSKTFCLISSIMIQLACRKTVT